MLDIELILAFKGVFSPVNKVLLDKLKPELVSIIIGLAFLSFEVVVVVFVETEYTSSVEFDDESAVLAGTLILKVYLLLSPVESVRVTVTVYEPTFVEPGLIVSELPLVDVNEEQGPRDMLVVTVTPELLAVISGRVYFPVLPILTV